MQTEIIASWADYEDQLRDLLGRAERHIRIFDADLSRLKLEASATAAALGRFLADDRSRRLTIVLRNPEPFRCASPRLIRLLTLNPSQMSVFECPEHLLRLKDCLVLVDDGDALIRFHEDNVRSRGIHEEPETCHPYLRRFEEILGEGGEPITATPLGL